MSSVYPPTRDRTILSKPRLQIDIHQKHRTNIGEANTRSATEHKSTSKLGYSTGHRGAQGGGFHG
jgi:hypothetical protein